MVYTEGCMMYYVLCRVFVTRVTNILILAQIIQHHYSHVLLEGNNGVTITLFRCNINPPLLTQESFSKSIEEKMFIMM